MISNDLLNKPIWQMTGEEFLELSRQSRQDEASHREENKQIAPATQHLEYGIAGIARIFGCSLPTANRIKKSGRIDGAITQVGRKIVIDVDKALELAGRRPTFNRRNNIGYGKQ